MADNKASQIASMADRLFTAQITAQAIAPISKSQLDLNLDDAYAIQLTNIQRAVAAGDRISGKKIGLTSLGMQQLLGVVEPDYGHLLESMAVRQSQVAMAGLLQPRIEAEIAFILKADLRGPELTAADVLAATDYVVGAFEIVDSRIADWKITLLDTVADNASSGRYLLGEKRFRPEDIDLVAETVQFYKNDQLYNSGSGRDVLGDPAFCVAWLANKLSSYGVTLNRGEVVLSGALSAAADAVSGDVFRAEYAHLGKIIASFI
ncbi:MAG: fumarylacetoacetate hydrolase family protein [Actinomycetia bacterium]|nr:fumarylacetoacetate hydrolase family protein [Actinomycetes bacterium]